MRTVVLLLLVSCSKPTAAPPDASPAPSASAVASAVPDGAAPDPEARAKEIVTKWSDALDKHDLEALRTVYADRVQFYTKSMTRDAVLEAKKKAFAATPSFRQSIGPITLVRDKETYTARFQKRSGGDKQSEVEARIVVTNGQIIVESDLPTTTPHRAKSCEDVAGELVASLPSVQKLAADEQKSTTTNWGGLGPIEEEGGGFTASLGEHSPERYLGLVWYTVTKDGDLTATVLGEDVTFSAADLAKVKAACKKK